MGTFGFILALLLVVGLVWVNLWYRREMKRLTPEQRKAEQEACDKESGIW